MRRLMIEEPYSQLALWSRRLAIFAGTAVIIGLGLAHSHKIEIESALSVLGAGLILACVALLLAGSALMVIWDEGRRGLGQALSASLIALLLLCLPGYLALLAFQLPILNDVTTDLSDPPSFSRSASALAQRSMETPADRPQTLREEQRRAYPDIQPILLDLEIDEAWRLIKQTLAAIGWRQIDQTPPGGRTGIAHLDAISQSLLLALPQDLTIRLKPLVGQTRVDVRSASRYGRHDFGSNADQIRRFAAELQNQLDAR